MLPFVQFLPKNITNLNHRIRLPTPQAATPVSAIATQFTDPLDSMPAPGVALVLAAVPAAVFEADVDGVALLELAAFAGPITPPCTVAGAVPGAP